jgi:TonB family protein
MPDAGQLSQPDQPHHQDAVGPVRVSRARFPIALSAALLAHVAVAVPFLLGEPEIGAAGLDRDAISINVVIVPATAIESQVAAAPSAPAASAEIHAEIGRETATAAPTEMTPPPPEREPAPKTEKSETAAPELAPIPVDVAAANTPTPQNQPAAPPPTPTAFSPGGVISVGAEAAVTAAPAAAAAAPGTAERYAKSVVEALGRSRPKGAPQGQRGTVKIVFAIADDGGLKFARIAASSGSSQLDAAALTALHRVTFPTPPNGLSLAQLTYEIPYRFR